MTLEVRRCFDGDVDDIAAARRLVAATLLEAAIADPDVVDVAQLAVTELVTNAIEHATGPVEVLVRVDAIVHVAVRDGSPDPPVARETGWEDERGRGLAIVDAIAARWGATPDGVGKWVWCDLRIERRR